MAGAVVQPNTIAVLCHVSTHGRPQLYTLHALYTTAGPLNPNIAETIFAQAKTNLTGNAALTHMATTFSFTGVGVRDLRTLNLPEIPSTGAAVSGSDAGTPLPDQASICVTLRTAMAGRSFRGRTYTFGWTSNSMNADGTIAVVAQTAAVNFVNAVAAGITTAGGTLAIRSPALPSRPAHDGSTLPPKDYFITPVTTVLCRDAIWDTNRRRLDLLRR